MSAFDDMLRELNAASGETSKVKAFRDKLTEMATMSRREYTLKRFRRATDGAPLSSEHFESMITYAEVLLAEMQRTSERGGAEAAIMLLPCVMLAGDIEALTILRNESSRKAA